MSGGNGWAADTEQIRAHAAQIEALRAGFDAVRSASTHISQNDQAYGQLCGWIAAILETRHQRHDELVTYLDENLRLVAERLRDTADSYDGVDSDTAGALGRISKRLSA